MECFICGASGDKALLFDAISENGIVKICRKCSFDEDIPVVRKPNFFGREFENPEKSKSVYERLSGSAGIAEKNVLERKEAERQNQEIKRVFEKNVLESAQYSRKMENLIDNFHWVVMRARRARKLTQEQFANEIGESESLVKLAEKGFIPEGKFEFVRKIEGVLGIRIQKKTGSSFEQDVEEAKDRLIQDVEKNDLKFDSTTTKTLTIADLQEMKKKKEDEIFEEKFVPADAPSENEPEFVSDKKDLTDEEMDDLIFGRE